MRDLHDNTPPQRLPHGYCNDTYRDGDLVVKQYTGPDAAIRAATESRILRSVGATVPVPIVKHSSETELATGFVAGRHGQDLLGPDRAAAVLAACGRVLADIQAVPVQSVTAGPAVTGVLVHGDFGPQNLLFAPDTLTVAAVLDWEWGHIGQPIEDLAWCEWIVRTHHADCVDALRHLYHGYGAEPAPWRERQAAMVSKCRAMHQFGIRRKDGSATVWQRRTAITAAWYSDW